MRKVLIVGEIVSSFVGVCGPPQVRRKVVNKGGTTKFYGETGSVHASRSDRNHAGRGPKPRPVLPRWLRARVGCPDVASNHRQWKRLQESPARDPAPSLSRREIIATIVLPRHHRRRSGRRGRGRSPASMIPHCPMLTMTQHGHRRMPIAQGRGGLLALRSSRHCLARKAFVASLRTSAATASSPDNARRNSRSSGRPMATRLRIASWAASKSAA
jgi:hypothetical protein